NLDAALTAFFEGETKPWVFVVITDQEAFKDKLKERLRRAILAARPVAEGDAAQTQVAADVLAERRRQVEAEGWSPEHDDAHGRGEIARAACSYAYEAGR
ncbi:hypothetical protein ACHWGL_30855, partial [Klebsiella pneumoniae]